MHRACLKRHAQSNQEHVIYLGMDVLLVLIFEDFVPRKRIPRQMLRVSTAFKSMFMLLQLFAPYRQGGKFNQQLCLIFFLDYAMTVLQRLPFIPTILIALLPLSFGTRDVPSNSRAHRACLKRHARCTFKFARASRMPKKARAMHLKFARASRMPKKACAMHL